MSMAFEGKRKRREQEQREIVVFCRNLGPGVARKFNEGFRWKEEAFKATRRSKGLTSTFSYLREEKHEI